MPPPPPRRVEAAHPGRVTPAYTPNHNHLWVTKRPVSPGVVYRHTFNETLNKYFCGCCWGQRCPGGTQNVMPPPLPIPKM